MKRILCAIDHSEPSLRAAQLAHELAVKCKSDLVLLNVVRLPEGKQEALIDYLQHEHSADPPSVVVVDSAHDELARLSDRLIGQSHIGVTCEVRAGEAAAEIVTSARERSIDMIVIGHRSHSRLAQVVVGSVARRVVDTAPCPVLVVR
jgi:nucleotide-binding universal stress UspA family protein